MAELRELQVYQNNIINIRDSNPKIIYECPEGADTIILSIQISNLSEVQTASASVLISKNEGFPSDFISGKLAPKIEIPPEDSAKVLVSGTMLIKYNTDLSVGDNIKVVSSNGVNLDVFISVLERAIK